MELRIAITSDNSRHQFPFQKVQILGIGKDGCVGEGGKDG